jgi:hypothetical protein
MMTARREHAEDAAAPEDAGAIPSGVRLDERRAHASVRD